MTCILIRRGRLVDPRANLDAIQDLLIVDGRIEAIGRELKEPKSATTIIKADGMIVAPGLVDIGTETREPGFEEDETIESVGRAAIAGGYTTIACLPNSDPPIDSQASVEFVNHQADDADWCHVKVLACVSKDRKGQELAEMGLLAEAGAIGFTDANAPLESSELMRRALEYAQMFDLPILNSPYVPELNRDGVMHEGFMSMLLGLSGMPSAAEDVMVARDIRLAESTGGRLHLLFTSTAESVELLRRAREREAPVTAGVPVANIAATDAEVRCFDARFKLNPPLRSEPHLLACVDGLKDGTIDVICSGHMPRAAEKKMDVLDAAPFGAAGLETTLGVVGTKLVQPGHLSWPEVLSKLSCNPAMILGLESKGSLAVGKDADVVVIDPEHRWQVEPRQFQSRCRSSPFDGWTLHGKARDVIVGGRLKLREGQLVS